MSDRDSDSEINVRHDQYIIKKCEDRKKDLRIQDLERQLKEARELIKAVAHIGIDWGYGKFELTQDHIDKARKLYEQQLKEQGKRK